MFGYSGDGIDPILAALHRAGLDRERTPLSARAKQLLLAELTDQETAS